MIRCFVFVIEASMRFGLVSKGFSFSFSLFVIVPANVQRVGSKKGFSFVLARPSGSAVAIIIHVYFIPRQDM